MRRLLSEWKEDIIGCIAGFWCWITAASYENVDHFLTMLEHILAVLVGTLTLSLITIPKIYNIYFKKKKKEE